MIDTPFTSVFRFSKSTCADRAAARSHGWRIALCVALAAVALVPVALVLAQWWFTARDVAYWDEIDTVLPFLLRLKEGMDPERFVGALLAVTNEHRTVTSRLLFAVSYWCTGTVDFVWIGAIGNAFIVAACGLLVAATRTAERRLQLAVVLGFTIFHLGSYENFLWSGASIDHFQVIALAVAALLALSREGLWPSRAALVCATLASFTLAHGLVVWPVGAVVLARARRWKQLAAWSATGAVVAAIFLAGFYWNTGHSIATSGGAMVRIVLRYWLEVLGAPLAFGHEAVAIGLGVLLVALVSVRTCWRGQEKDGRLLPVLWFLLGGALLIAFGRAEFAHGHVFSRYFIVGGLAWALMLFEIMGCGAFGERPWLALGAVLPLLGAFNLAQNIHYAGEAATFVENRDRAALRYRQFGEDGRTKYTLHPDPRHATELLTAAARSGVYRMPPVCMQREFPAATPSARMPYFVDEFTLNDRAAYLAGWVGLEHEKIARGSVHVILRSAERTLMFTTVPVRRPDVVNTLHQPDWEWSGFRFAIKRELLPPAEYRIGFLVEGEPCEFVMTEHRLDLRGAGAAHIAGGD